MNAPVAPGQSLCVQPTFSLTLHIYIQPGDSSEAVAAKLEEVARVFRSGPAAHPVPEAPGEKPAACEDTWFSHEQAAEYLKISPSTLYKKASAEEISYDKSTGKNRYRRSELDRYVEAHQKSARITRTRGRIIPLALSSGK